MLGMALEGGGARGSYHIGVAKAYLENGYRFDGFVGTSIGAANAAVLAQGDFEKALRLWENLTMERLFDVDDKALIELSGFKLKKNLFTNLRNSVKKLVADGGVDTQKLRAVIGGLIDEEKVRGSKKDFGLVTVSISERKPYELYIEDIPQGLLLNYIMASASFPGFKSEIINELHFIDGGLFNNCPVNLLLDKGYDEIVAVRTMAPGIFRPIKSGNAKVTLITPNVDLGNMLIFSQEQSVANIKLGYFDGLRQIKNLYGRLFYINNVDEKRLENMLFNVPDEIILKAGEALGIRESHPKRMLYERIVPRLARHFELPENFSHVDFVIALLEKSGVHKKIERFTTHDFNDFLHLVKTAPWASDKVDRSTLRDLTAAYIISAALE